MTHDSQDILRQKKAASRMIRAPGRPANGFTLIEVVVAIIILVMIAAAVTPNIIREMDRSRVNAAVTELDALATAIGRFRTDVGAYPRSLLQLANPLGSSDLNSCQVVITTPNLWRGPYLSRVVPTGGLPTLIGLAQLTLVRNPTSTSTTAGTLRFLINNVRQEDADALNLYYDADGSSTAGTIQWQAGTNGQVILNFVRPVGTSC
jgi:type II secretion system protein G